MNATVRLIDDARAVGLLADPVRRQILQRLTAPGSATSIARELGLPRQRIRYHMRELEKHGFVELLREERKRGCVERVMRRTSDSIVLAPDSLTADKLHPQSVRDRFSSLYLIALASQMLREVTAAQVGAKVDDKLLPTFSLQVDVRIATQQDKNAFAEELGREIARLAVKYHQPQSRGGRSFRVIVGSYPAPPGRAAERAENTTR
ncbi:MAG TPA: helix-turn-helix domain-containing protein [Steroidobacteraceae bacterium]|nr:helix-turn-helix domain-containing protein [Steroidobacteraceae bacterium]